MAPPRVAIVSESFYMAGVKIVIGECVAAIKETWGYDPLLIGNKHPGCEDVPGLWLRSILIPPFGRGYRVVLPLPSTYKAILKSLRETDIVHIHSISLLTLLVIWLIRRRLSTKIVLHLHTQQSEYLRQWLGPVLSLPGIWLTKCVTRWCSQKSDRVICPTSFFARILQSEIGALPNLEVWQAPISIPEDLSQDYGLDPDITRLLPDKEPLIVYVGRIVPEKNIKFLFQVFADLDSLCTRAHLALVGNGDIEKYKKMAPRFPSEVSKRIIFTGPLPRPHVLLLNQYATLGITASLTETQGLGLFEQMALGLPVAVMENTCMGQVVSASSGGLILPPNPLIWAQEISTILADLPAQLTMGGNGERYIRQHFSPATQHQKLRDIYVNLIG